MKYSNGMVISTVALALIITGCVKKTDTAPVAYDNPQPVYDNTQVIYDSTTQPPATTQPIYETTSAPIIYDETLTSSSGITYSEVPLDNTVITTGNSYGEVVDAGTSYAEPVVAVNTGNSAYSNPYGSSSESYPDPYGNSAIVSDYPASSSNNSNSYTSSPAPRGGIHLQIAALKNYSAAEEFKNSLSLDPKYSAYIKRGAINKVIITGMTSISEVNRLKENRFPGSFVVSGGSSYSSSSSSSSSSYSGGGYTDNTPYGNPASYGGGSSSSSSNSGVGVQIGAFSSRAKAQSVANANGGRYKAIVSQGTSQGRRIYRVVLTGFSSRAAAKRALDSGQIQNGFVTSNY